MINDQIDFDENLRIAHDLLQIQDLDILLEQLLSKVRDISTADAGSIYLSDGATLKFSCTQNDTLQKKLPFGKKLIYSTFSVSINNASIAGYVANTGIIVNLHDAYHIDEFQPYSFDKEFDNATGYRTQSMLSVPIKIPTGRVIGVIQLINSLGKNKTIRQFSSMTENVVQLFADNVAIAIEHAQMTRAMIIRINKLLEYHDLKENEQHNNRVAAYSVEIYELWAHKKGILEKDIEHNRDTLRMAAMLHDIGKGALPSYILKKNELPPKEKRIYQTYPIYGAMFFQSSSSSFEEMARSIALNHREKWDGSGFPGHVNLEDGKPLPGYEKGDGTALGKSGNEIPIFARIVSVAHTYDTLIHPTITGTKEKISKELIDKATKEILADSGLRFDPEIVVDFLDCIDMINSISERYPDNRPVEIIQTT